MKKNRFHSRHSTRLIHGRRLIGVVAPLGLALLITACGSTSTAATSSSQASSTANSAKAASPYVIHAIVSATGSAASVGSGEEAALKGAEAYVNSTGGIDGHPLHFAIEDNQSSPSVAASLAASLVASKVPIIMAGTLGSTVAAVDGLVTSSGPLVFNLSPVNSGPPHSYIFADSASLPQLILASMVYAKDRGWTRIAALTTTDTSGATGLKSLQAALKQPALSDIKVVANETFDPSAVSVAPQLAVIKAANPQAVFEWSTGSPTATFFQDYSQAGMVNIPVLTGYGNAVPQVLERFGSSLPTYLYFANERFELGPSALSGAAAATTKAFYDAMASQNSQASANASLGWDPAMILVDALRHLGVNATPAQIKSYIESIHGFQGANGVYNFSPTNHRGYNATSLVMTQWVKQSNKFTVSTIKYPSSLAG